MNRTSAIVLTSRTHPHDGDLPPRHTPRCQTVRRVQAIERSQGGCQFLAADLLALARTDLRHACTRAYVAREHERKRLESQAAQKWRRRDEKFWSLLAHPSPSTTSTIELTSAVPSCLALSTAATYSPPVQPSLRRCTPARKAARLAFCRRGLAHGLIAQLLAEC
jgi:hypothetical protein